MCGNARVYGTRIRVLTKHIYYGTGTVGVYAFLLQLEHVHVMLRLRPSAGIAMEVDGWMCSRPLRRAAGNYLVSLASV